MNSPIRNSLSMAALALTLSFALPDRAHAAEYLTAVAGGGGGNPFTFRCAPDQVLAGVTGKAGAWADQIQALCVQVDALGRWIGSPWPPGDDVSMIEWTEHARFTLVCPPDHAVSGIQGRAATLIDQLRIRCGHLTAGAKLASSGSVLAGQGGTTGGNPFGPFDCVDNKPGRALIGRSDVYVDQLRLACDYPPSPVTTTYAMWADASLEGKSIVRTRSPRLRVLLSSETGVVYVPVKSNNPNVAVPAFDSGHTGEIRFERSFERYMATLIINGTGAGCASFEVGFPGNVEPPLSLLLDGPAATQLALSLSILDWTKTTTSAFGTLTIPTAAPSGGVSVTLTSSQPTLALIPTSVTIPAGSRSTTFEIRRSGSATLGACVIVTAKGNGVSVQSAMLFPFTGVPSGRN